MENKTMKHNLIFLVFSMIVLLIACGGPPAYQVGKGKPGFRVRSDFAATLNSDQGWAGALNENVTVYADQPFRIRFEWESPSGTARDQQLRLQYRRNNGAWTIVEAHDFPYPERDISVDFARLEAGTRPDGWTVVKGNSSGMVAVADNHQNLLRVKADQEPLVGLFTLPWDVTEMASQFRLAPDNQNGIAFVVGYADINNYCLVQLDPNPGTIRISQVINGVEANLAEKHAVIPFGHWLEIEIDTENRVIEVNFQNDMLEMDVTLDTDITHSKPGFQIPSNTTIDFQQFSFGGEAKTPRVSIVTCPGYEHGLSTKDLLKGSATSFQDGTGMSLTDLTPVWISANAHGEFEWPVVIRRFADGAVTNNQDDTFEFRMVDADSTIAGIEHNPVLRLSIPPGHVGGTFVENPGRIGPWQASNGDLYFIMEPTETDNLFMMIKSTDNGRTWREIDGENRPGTNDLESVDSRLVGNTIHIIHQVTRSARYHSFRTSDHPTHPDTWAIRDEVAGSVDAIAQTASMVVRSNGSIVAFYLGQEKIHYSIRSSEGTWSQVRTFDSELQPNQAGPQAVLGKNDIIHLAYYGIDGTIWYRRFLPNETLTPRQLLATGAGDSRAEYGAMLPLIYNPNKDEVVIIYRLATGNLWERRIVNDAPPTDAVMITDIKVVTDAVDSQQAGADATLEDETVHVLFIEESSRSIFSIHDNGGWQNAKPQVENILGSWVRGNVYTRKDGLEVYGYVYDAGSYGGAGMNRFGELVLNDR
jgi:hypothetical protein